MAWLKVDDRFPRHPKVVAAARHLGKNGVGRVLAVWLEGLCYCGEHLTDGFLPELIAQNLISDARALDVLDVMALPEIGLMTKGPSGYWYHDFLDYQPSSHSIKEKRERDRRRKDSARNPNGIAVESERNPARSRARDPVPVPQVDQNQDPGAPRRVLAFVSMADVKRHLRAAVHATLDANPAADESDVAEAVKQAAAALRVDDYQSRRIQQLIERVIAYRKRRAA